MSEGSSDPGRNPDLAAKNRRVAIILALVAVAVYVLFIVGTAL